MTRTSSAMCTMTTVRKGLGLITTLTGHDSALLLDTMIRMFQCVERINHGHTWMNADRVLVILLITTIQNNYHGGEYYGGKNRTLRTYDPSSTASDFPISPTAG